MTGPSRRQALRWLGGAAALLAACTGRSTSGPTATGRTSTAVPTAAEAPDPSPTATPTPDTTATPRAVVPMVCRDAWGARAPSGPMVPHTIRQLTVHHSAAAATDTTQGPAHLRGYQAFHMDDRGWGDIAYHVGVDRAGVVYRLRDWDVVGDTGTDYDPTGHFLLLLDGNFDDHDVTEAQLDAAASVLAWAAEHFGVALDTVSGHRDHASTACPGDALYARLDDLRGRAGALAAAGSVRLVDRCGPAAAAAVAELEAGGLPDLLV